MGDTQGLVPHAYGKLINCVRHGKIVCHPAVADHTLHAAPGERYAYHDAPQIQPAAKIIEGILNASPLTALSDLAVIKKHTVLLITLFLFGIVYYLSGFHFFAPPWRFLISMLSINAWTRVLI